MNGHTAMPIIEFGEGTDYGSLYSLLYVVNKGMESEPGEGITWEFILTDNRRYVGTYLDDSTRTTEDDSMVIALHQAGAWTGETVTVNTDDIISVVYL